MAPEMPHLSAVGNESSRQSAQASSSSFPMSKKQIGGEYGEIRASINVTQLNMYLLSHVPVVNVPVTVKQFKVSCSSFPYSTQLTFSQFGQVRISCIMT